MAKYREKPEIVEAMQVPWPDDEWADFHYRHGQIVGWFAAHEFKAWSVSSVKGYILWGAVHAAPGDYIIRKSGGEFYTCGRELFEATHEPWEGD